jgi:hypothetical protein
MNKALLGHLSSYYKAIFDNRFAESTNESFIVELFPDDLYAFDTWIHDGVLAVQWKRPPGFDSKQLFRLYIFADYHDFPALRRTIMSMLVRCRWEISFRDLFVHQVGDCLSQLPETSPLYQWLATVWANHVLDGARILDSEVIYLVQDALPQEFLDLVKGIRIRNRRLRYSRCRCCHHPCDFHEHQSVQEWEMSKSFLGCITVSTIRC